MLFFRAYLPVFLWMLLIFTVSGQAGSTDNTNPIIGAIVRWFHPAASDSTIDTVSYLVRKSAHLTEYAILAILIWRSRRIQLQEGLVWRAGEMLPIVVICALYAASDEFHQSFVPNRQGNPLDVLIDTVGATLGLLVVSKFCRWRGKRTKD